jgi:4-hydroxy-tetrahydrodipicolinate reductase
MNVTSQRLWLHGFDGRMGQSIRKALLDDPRFNLQGGSSHQRIFVSDEGSSQEQFHIDSFSATALARALESVDIIIDFSSAAGNATLIKTLQSNNLAGKAVMIGTTGLGEGTTQKWVRYVEEQQGKVLFAPNTSLGIYLLVKLAQQAASVLRPQGFDIEICETHHRHKKDSPSGTAKFVAQVLADQENLRPQYQRQGLRESDELGVVALRGGSVFGEHEVRLMGDLEELGLTHRALSRELFAKGALRLGEWLAQAKSGQAYRLTDIPLEQMAK